MISNEEGIHIIDWEYFCPAVGPFGFDAYNLLFEQLWFSMKRKNGPNRNELDVLRDCIMLLRSSSKDGGFFSHKPLYSLRTFMKSNSGYWENQIHRFPVMLFDEEHVGIVDKMLRLNA